MKSILLCCAIFSLVGSYASATSLEKAVKRSFAIEEMASSYSEEINELNERLNNLKEEKENGTSQDRQIVIDAEMDGIQLAIKRYDEARVRVQESGPLDPGAAVDLLASQSPWTLNRCALDFKRTDKGFAIQGTAANGKTHSVNVVAFSADPASSWYQVYVVKELVGGKYVKFVRIDAYTTSQILNGDKYQSSWRIDVNENLSIRNLSFKLDDHKVDKPNFPPNEAVLESGNCL